MEDTFSHALSQSNLNVEVLAIKPLTNTGNLRAFVSVRVGEITIHNCRIVQQPGQRPWVSLPQREYSTPDGQRKFAPLVELSESLKRGISLTVLTQWEQMGRNRWHDEAM